MKWTSFGERLPKVGDAIAYLLYDGTGVDAIVIENEKNIKWVQSLAISWCLLPPIIVIERKLQHPQGWLKPSYTFGEVLTLIPLLNRIELFMLGEVLQDEKHRYCLVDLRIMKEHLDAAKQMAK